VLAAGVGVVAAVATDRAVAALPAGGRRGAYAAILVGAAAVYPLARRDRRLGREGLVELGAVAAYAVTAARSGDRALAAGWASHAAFDRVHHAGPDSLIPDWYPAMCAGYDLLLAGVLAVRGSGS
jgi:hypothetical protein